MDIAQITAYFSLLALSFTVITLSQFKAERHLACGFAALAVNIVLNLLGFFARLYPILYSLRFIYGTCFIIYAWEYKRKK